MRAHQVVEHGRHPLEVLHAQRKHPEPVAHHGVGSALVDGAPALHLAAVLLEHPLREANKERDVLLWLEAALVLKPQRVGEVVQGNHGLNACSDERIDHGVVVRDRLRIEAPFLGLDPAPLNAESIAVEAELVLHALNVFGIALPVLGRRTRAIAVVDARVPFLVDRILPSCPVVVGVSAIDLVCSRR